MTTTHSSRLDRIVAFAFCESNRLAKNVAQETNGSGKSKTESTGGSKNVAKTKGTKAIETVPRKHVNGGDGGGGDGGGRNRGLRGFDSGGWNCYEGKG